MMMMMMMMMMMIINSKVLLTFLWTSRRLYCHNNNNNNNNKNKSLVLHKSPSFPRFRKKHVFFRFLCLVCLSTKQKAPTRSLDGKNTVI